MQNPPGPPRPLTTGQEEESQVNNLSSHLEDLEEQRKQSDQKEGNNENKAEISHTEN